MQRTELFFVFSRGRDCLKRLSIASLLGVGLVASVSAQTETALSSEKTGVQDLRPSNVPAHYVVTPFGYFSPSCMQEIREGEELLENEAILRSDGSVEQPVVCTQDNFTRQGVRVSPQGRDEEGNLVRASSEKAIPPPAIDHSYIQSALYISKTAIGKISAHWTVPLNPTVRNKQTIYFFPALQGSTIMQPVLGYRGESDTWDVSSWNCCVDGIVTHSILIPVKSGDEILGSIYSTCAAGVACNRWNIDTYNMTTGTRGRFTSTPNGDPRQVMGGALEVYDVAACGEYPPSGTLTFQDIEVYDRNMIRVQSPPWHADTFGQHVSPQCNYSSTFTPKSVTITF